jgi:hypothetical protein
MLLRIDYSIVAKLTNEKKEEEEKSVEEIEKIEQDMIPGVLKKTAEDHKEDWEKGLNDY